MKRNDIKELHNQTIEELKVKLAEVIKSFDQARSENAAGKLKNTNSLYQLKKDIARVKTVLRHKELLMKAQSTTTK
jgi:large subunit ribosomal protein L29